MDFENRLIKDVLERMGGRQQAAHSQHRQHAQGILLDTTVQELKVEGRIYEWQDADGTTQYSPTDRPPDPDDSPEQWAAWNRVHDGAEL